MKYYDAEIKEFCKHADIYAVSLEQKLREYKRCLENLSLDGGAMEGEAANAIDNYIYEVPYPTLCETQNILERYSDLLTNTYNAMHIEVDDKADLIDAEYLYELSRHIGAYGSTIAAYHSDVERACAKASAIVALSTPNVNTILDSVHTSKGYVDTAKEDFENFNANHLDDLVEVKDRLHAIKMLCRQNNNTKLDENGVFQYVSTINKNDILSSQVSGVSSMSAEELRLINRMILVSPDGTIVYNMEFVEELLQKNVVIKEEIIALSSFYLSINDTVDGYTREENMQRFVAYGYKPVNEIIYLADDQTATVTYMQTTNAFNAVALTTTGTVHTLFAGDEHGLISLTNEQTTDLLEKMATLQIAIKLGGQIEILPHFTWRSNGNNGFTPILLTYREDGLLQIQVITGQITDINSDNCTYSPPTPIGGESGPTFASGLAGAARRGQFLADNGYNQGFIAWFQNEGGNFTITESITQTVGYYFPDMMKVSSALVSFYVSAFISIIDEVKDQNRMESYDEDASRYDRIEWLGGGVFQTPAEGMPMVEHGVSFANRNSYLRTGAFVQRYQNEIDGLTFENAQMILRNEALGNNPLPENVCGYTAEEQRRMGITYFETFYPRNLSQPGDDSYLSLYRQGVLETADNNNYNEDGVITLTEWVCAIEEYNSMSEEVVL